MEEGWRRRRRQTLVARSQYQLLEKWSENVFEIWILTEKERCDFLTSSTCISDPSRFDSGQTAEGGGSGLLRGGVVEVGRGRRRDVVPVDAQARVFPGAASSTTYSSTAAATTTREEGRSRHVDFDCAALNRTS